MRWHNVKRVMDFVGLMRYEEKRDYVKSFEEKRDLTTGARKPAEKPAKK